jgi:hypothetical protein
VYNIIVNTEILITDLVKTPGTDTEVLTTGLVKTPGTNTEVLIAELVSYRCFY